jgi:hypothetical protein
VVVFVVELVTVELIVALKNSVRFRKPLRHAHLRLELLEESQMQPFKEVWIEEQTGAAGMRAGAWLAMQQLQSLREVPFLVMQLQLLASTLRSL